MKTALCLFSLAAASLTGQTWSPQAAAGYLDGRLQWWSTWSGAQHDHDTFCISCHTVLPYALGRPALRSALGETAPSSPEAALLALHAPLADTTLALDNMLGEQLTSGDAAGAWPWLQFHNAPWEGDSQFMGATLAALAPGRAPPLTRQNRPSSPCSGICAAILQPNAPTKLCSTACSLPGRPTAFPAC